jgi:hypothetical protein
LSKDLQLDSSLFKLIISAPNRDYLETILNHLFSEINSIMNEKSIRISRKERYNLVWNTHGGAAGENTLPLGVISHPGTPGRW